ncbi:MAG TPA: permease-like cell division protein FtsX [Chthonomonadaceae bacterium]|nr:permease-like cell division protein FtsX [Chthonomonadaceae bacterium]
MSLSSLMFLLHEGYLNIRRNGLMSLAALGTVTVALTVLGASLWTAYRISEIAQQQPQTFNSVRIFLHPELERDKALSLQERLTALPDVRSVHFVPKEQAWAELDPKEGLTKEDLPFNPLSDAYDLEVKDAGHVSQLAQLLRDPAQFPEMDHVSDAGEEVAILLGFARLVKVIGGSAAIGLFIATFFIVQNTIRLTVFTRRREIRIMQLVGATSGFIRLPLLLEGLFHGVVGGLIAGGLILLAGHEVARVVSGFHSPLIPDVPSRLGPVELVGGLVAIGALVGLLGSYLSMRRFLKQL